jgi:hypothetical protein
LIARSSAISTSCGISARLRGAQGQRECQEQERDHQQGKRTATRRSHLHVGTSK